MFCIILLFNFQYFHHNWYLSFGLHMQDFQISNSTPQNIKKIVLHSIQFFLPDRFFTQALPLVPLTNIRYDFNISVWSSAYFDRFSILVLEEKCCSWSWDIPPYLMEYLWGFEVVPNFGQARQKAQICIEWQLLWITWITCYYSLHNTLQIE